MQTQSEERAKEKPVFLWDFVLRPFSKTAVESFSNR